MRAAIFVRTLQHGRKIYQRENAINYMFLADVAVCNMHPDNYKRIRQSFQEMAFGKRKRKAFDLKDPMTAHILGAMLQAGQPRSGAIPPVVPPPPPPPEFVPPKLKHNPVRGRYGGH